MTFKVSIGHFLLPLIAFAAISGSVVSCQKDDPVEDPKKVSMVIKTTPGVSESSSTPVYVFSDSPWTLSFKTPVSWASFDKTEGTGDQTVNLSFDKNTGSQWRSVTVVFQSNSKTIERHFFQRGQGAPDITPDSITDWMELPEANTSGLYFINHPMTIGSLNTRNYSYYWDPDNLVAHWVAYPLNNTLLTGGSGRSEQWGLDPKVPREYQPVLYSPFSGGGVRGHQIPSADRQQLKYNIETYYGVNMTPQNSGLNGGVWASLEGYVRDRSREVDTLYVVTGCIVAGSTYKARDNDNKSVTVPTAYFKALLAYKKTKNIGITNQTGGYTGIGFYFRNSNYSGSYMSESMTISQLEEKTGMKFFVNLNSVIGDNIVTKVKTTEDNWWNK